MRQRGDMPLPPPLRPEKMAVRRRKLFSLPQTEALQNRQAVVK